MRDEGNGGLAEESRHDLERMVVLTRASTTTPHAHTRLGYHTRKRGWGRSGYAFFERRRLLFARRLRRHQDAAALDPVQRLRAAVGRGRRAGLGDSRARLRRVARRDGRRWRHGGRASGFRRYIDSVADAGADGSARSGRDEELAVCAREARRDGIGRARGRGP